MFYVFVQFINSFLNGYHLQWILERLFTAIPDYSPFKYRKVVFTLKLNYRHKKYNIE